MLGNEEAQLLLPVLHREVAHPLARYKDSKSIRMMSTRLVSLDKSKHGLTLEEGLQIAQAALAKGLSPFEPRKELHYWVDIPDKGHNKDKRILTIMDAAVGIIRLSEEAARRDGTYLEDTEHRVLVDPVEKQDLGFEAKDLVVECKVRDYRAVQNYYNRRNGLKDEGLTTEKIDERLGTEPPCLIGYGAMSEDEMDKIDWGEYYDKKKQKKIRYRKRVTYPHINRTKKRAYTAALVQRWAALVDVGALQEASAGLPDERFIVEGEWRDVIVDDPKQLAERAKTGATTLYGVACPACGGALQDPPPMDCPHCGVQGIGHKLAAEKLDTPEPVEDIKEEGVRIFSAKLLSKIVEAGLAPDTEEALSGLRRSPWNSKDVPLRSHTNVLDWYRVFQAERDRGARSDKAARIATEGAKGIT